MKGIKNITVDSEDLSKIARKKLSPKLNISQEILREREIDISMYSGNLSPHGKVKTLLGSYFQKCILMVKMC